MKKKTAKKKLKSPVVHRPPQVIRYDSATLKRIADALERIADGLTLNDMMLEQPSAVQLLYSGMSKISQSVAALAADNKVIGAAVATLPRSIQDDVTEAMVTKRQDELEPQ